MFGIVGFQRKKKNHKTPNWIRSKWKDFSFDEAKFKRGFRLWESEFEKQTDSQNLHKTHFIIIENRSRNHWFEGKRMKKMKKPTSKPLSSCFQSLKNSNQSQKNQQRGNQAYYHHKDFDSLTNNPEKNNETQYSFT